MFFRKKNSVKAQNVLKEKKIQQRHITFLRKKFSEDTECS